jgi:hypothetical protein
VFIIPGTYDRRCDSYARRKAAANAHGGAAWPIEPIGWARSTSLISLAATVCRWIARTRSTGVVEVSERIADALAAQAAAIDRLRQRDGDRRAGET